MSENANRPEAGTKKIHSKNEFELCYLRHQYLRKAKTNPTEAEMKPFMGIASHMAKNTYYTYKNLFGMVGFDVDDLVSIANVHLVSFLGLFSLDKLPEKYGDFVNLYRTNKQPDPNSDQLMSKDKANCTLFMKQRMEDVVRVCRQKARNIKGLPTEEYFFYCGIKKPPKILKNLVGAHERFGYRKLDQAVYKSIRKRMLSVDGPVFRFNDYYYVAVPVDQKSLAITDLIGADMDPRDSIHNMSPEEIFFRIEDENTFEKQKEAFDSKSERSKKFTLKKFIQKHRRNPKYQDELRVARRMLKGLA